MEAADYAAFTTLPLDDALVYAWTADASRLQRELSSWIKANA